MKKLRSLAELRRKHPRPGKLPGKVEPLYAVWGALICEVRERLGITQAELARRLGVTRANVSNMESGRQRVHLHDVARYGYALGVEPMDLAGAIIPQLKAAAKGA